MKTRTVITRERRHNTSLLKLLNELVGDPTHSLYIEAEGAEQDVLLFRIYQIAGKLRLRLHVRACTTGVWVRSPYAKCNLQPTIPDEVRIAVIGIEGEKQLCLMVTKIHGGVAEFEAVEITPTGVRRTSAAESAAESEEVSAPDRNRTANRRQRNRSGRAHPQD